MPQHTITIGDLRQSGLGEGLCYQDKLIVTNHIEDIERFKLPCRINAITALLCIDGEMDFRINLKTYHMEHNMIVVCFPNDIIQILHTNELEAYAVLMASDLLDEQNINFEQRADFYLDIHENAVLRIPHAEIVALQPYYTLLSKNMQIEHPESVAVIRGLVSAFSYTVIGLMNQSTLPLHNEEADNMNRNKQLFSKFMNLVQQHYASARGVSFYADKLCLTPNYLSSAIKHYTGRSATDWVNEYVTLEAKMMLRDSDLSIQEIARRLCFSSQSAFGKYFKKQVGIGPKMYRRGELTIEN